MAVALMSFLGPSGRALEFSKGRTLCGPDDRTFSQSPYVARTRITLDGRGGCSATLISRSCLVSVAHCYGVHIFAEFNVPRSTGMDLQTSAPEDVYEVDRSTLKYSTTPNTKGHDWIVFRVKPNTVTAKLPGDAQGGWAKVSLAAPKTGAALRVTGFGRDDRPEHHHSEQTSTGKIVSMGNAQMPLIYHDVDTLGGNSGSGIFLESTGEIIGVHSGGDCAAGGNVATSIALSPQFIKAIQDCQAQDALLQEF